MATTLKKTIMAKESLPLTYENCMEIMRQFDERFPSVRTRNDFLAQGVNKEGHQLILKITLMHPGVKSESISLKLPKDFDVHIENKKWVVRIVSQIAPVLPNASPKSIKTKD